MKIGILSLHFANNYGAVLQVFSLQKKLVDMGCNDVEVIDFANVYQIDADSLYPIRNGIKRLCKRLLMLHFHKKRKARIRKFECFRKRYLNLTETYNEENNVINRLNEYDVIIVGSDQIWNPRKGKEISDIYFLKDVKRSKKIAYAASIGNALSEDLLNYKVQLSDFDYISLREKRGLQVLKEMNIGKIEHVLDPTLIVNPIQLKAIELKYSLPFEKYIFYYSLDGFNKRQNNVDNLLFISQVTGLPVVVVCPEWPKGLFYNVIDAGPQEFLWLLDNAFLVCTNSFHGTALSISLRKNFIVLEEYDGMDDRKISVLKEFNLEQRLSSDRGNLLKLIDTPVPYNEINQLIEKKIKSSENFLKRALN